jgi:hypothetical protein
VVARDFPQRRIEGCWADDLIHQTVPLASFDAVAQRRHHALGPDRCFGPPPLAAAAGFCPLRSLFRHSRGGLLLHSRPRTSNFLPSFPRSGFAAAPLHGPRPYRGIMKALTPAALHPTGRSLRLLRFAVPAFRPQPRKLPAGRFASRLSAAGCFQTSPPMSRLATALRRIRFVILRTPGSPPVAPHPRLAATQLPSIAEPATGSGADLHRADKAPSRTHSCPQRAVSRAQKCAVPHASIPTIQGGRAAKKPATWPRRSRLHRTISRRRQPRGAGKRASRYQSRWC